MNEVVSLNTLDRVAVIEINSPPVNALSQAVRQGITEKLQAAIADEKVGAIVLTCAGRTFIAGADIREFGSPPLAPHLPDVVAALEASPKPVVAAIHGTALGGGFEIALGCHYRVALKSARVGLPEVKLGLLPGAGGTQRLPRLVGVQTALPMIMSGDPVTAEEAEQMGAVDHVVNGDLLVQALEYAEKLLDESKPPRRLSDIRIDPASVPENFYTEFRALHARKTRGYFAPERIIAAVQAAVGADFQDGMQQERDLFMGCMRSPESAALRHIFFAERQAGKVDGLERDTPLREINRVAMIGAGTMGGGIAMNFASKGMLVYMVDVDTAAIERGMAVVRANYMRGVKKGRMTEAQFDSLMELFIPVTDYAELADADLVIEAVFENMAVKKDIFKRLDAACKPGAILASNTSTLDIDEIARATSRPQDVLGMHFFSPANIMRLLEVVRGAETAPDVLATAMKLAKRIGKVGVVSGVCHGFIGNRMLEGYIREAGIMLLEGARPEQIDKVLYDFGFPMGPIAMGDLAGIDVGAKVREERRRKGMFPADERFGLVADRLVAMGRCGQKTSAGVYRYEPGSRTPIPDPEVQALIESEADRLGIVRREISDHEILTRCVYPLINEGARILDEGIAQRASDIDVVWVNGYGFPPYRGGPMFYADAVGAEKIYTQICQYRETLGNEFGYWEPAPLLEKLAREGGKFSAFSKS
ncbi:MAG: enoyl-CoA hydratase/isomerase family protein [Gammaproteobacteria bacterium]|nr:enoyl-CoA hydratase/isomerase family protein [Gammaproteobacteria bacterium]NNK99524.1 3-hydroxyacyl-CoA dehydrogenase [Xanthomonadales bacterium]